MELPEGTEFRPATSGISTLLRIEGAVIAAVAIFAYLHLGGPPLLAVVLFLVPDLSMLGYLRGPKVGAVCYNVAHTYLFAVAILALWTLWPDIHVLWITAIWTFHIGFDRMLGYGLKSPEGFRVTHLQRV